MKKAVYIFMPTLFALSSTEIVYGSSNPSLAEEHPAINGVNGKNHHSLLSQKNKIGGVSGNEAVIEDDINQIIASGNLEEIGYAIDDAERTGNFKEAVRLYEASLAINDDPYTKSQYGILLLNSKQEQNWSKGAQLLIDAAMTKLDITQSFLWLLNANITDAINSQNDREKAIDLLLQTRQKRKPNAFWVLDN